METNMNRSKSSSFASITDLFRPNNPKGLRPRALSTTRLNVLKQEIKTDTHVIPLKELYQVLETNPERGLTSERAAVLLAYHGHNALTPATQNGWLTLLLKSMFTGFSVLIWLGAVLCLLAYLIEYSTRPDASKDNLYLGCVLIFVDITCGLFSFSQNYKSGQILKTFNSLLPTNAQCLRDGSYKETQVRDLVKGDIVYVKSGDVVPADMRIIESKGFKVDNSSLTGESVAVTRGNVEGHPNILESPNVAFFSTQCVEGWAKGIILCCGDLTALGRVAGLAARLSPAPSPLNREINRFMRGMSIWAVTLGIIIATAALAVGYPFMQTTIFVIGIVVANIPEGLQPTITAALTLTAQQMVKKNCLVKNLFAIEALGACSTICSDKTGTLTENKMRVRDIWLWKSSYSVIEPDFFSTLQNSDAFMALKLCGALCSTATIKDDTVRGDASETAILNFLRTYDNITDVRNAYPKVAEIPFNSTNKFQVSVHLNSAAGTYIVMMKGAPETIINRCSTIVTKHSIEALTKDMKDAVDKATEALAKTGERVLAFADCELDAKNFPLNYDFDTDKMNFPVNNIRLIGLMGLIDPPRNEVRRAIQRVREAGVRVMMVTGDHPATALAIAFEVGIASNNKCHVITGAELRKMNPEMLSWTLYKHYEMVFARTSPTQKLQIVEACQRQGAIVAVTGDGVNDAPALRRADIGISMGITGSQVSKQTADIILMDDNFATIVTGIEEGRKIFDNLKKSICYILISNVPEILPVMMFIIFSIPLPLGVMTILCIDLGTDMWPAVALSHETAESNVMLRPPHVGHPLVSASMLRLVYIHIGLMEFAAGMYAYFFVMAQHGFYPSTLLGIRKEWDNEAISDLKDSLGQEWTYPQRKELERACQATYFISVVVTQMMNGIICKTTYNSLFSVGLRNNFLNCGIIFELFLAVFICYTPYVNTFFRTYPLKWQWWFLPLPFALFIFVFDEFRKYCIRHKSFGGWFNNLTYY